MIEENVKVTVDLEAKGNLGSALDKDKAAADALANSVDKSGGAGARPTIVPPAPPVGTPRPQIAWGGSATMGPQLFAQQFVPPVLPPPAAATPGFFSKEANQMGERIQKVGRAAGVASGALLAAQSLGGGATPGGAVDNATGILTGALGGAAAGSFAGPIGTGVGAAIGAVGGIFSAISKGADKIKQEAEKSAADAAKIASTIFGSEASLRRLRSGEAITSESLTTAAPEAAAAIARAAPADRARVLREESAKAAAALADVNAGAEARTIRPGDSTISSGLRFMRSGEPVGVDISPEERTKKRLAAETLAAGVARGVEGITRPVSLATISTGLGSSASIGEGIMNALAGKSPAVAAAERSATAAEATLKALEEIRNYFNPTAALTHSLTPGAT